MRAASRSEASNIRGVQQQEVLGRASELAPAKAEMEAYNGLRGTRKRKTVDDEDV